MNNPLRGIPRAEIQRCYQDRGLSRLSDVELVHHVADIVKRPKQKTTSFSLHAPLELLARYALLAAVTEERRTLARLHLVALASAWERGGEEVEAPPSLDWSGGVAGAARALREAIAARDVERTDALAVWLAGHAHPIEFLGEITDLSLDYLGSAAHTPILLYLIARAGPGVRSLQLVPGALRGLAADADKRLRTSLEPEASRPPSVGPAELERAFFEGLLGARRIGPPEGWGIAALVEHVEGQGVPQEAMARAWSLGGLGGEAWEPAFRGLTRGVARLMIEDTVDRAKYGWTHALTIPQALWPLRPYVGDRLRALRLASVVAVSHRAGLGERALGERLELPASRAPLEESLREGPAQAAAAAYHATGEHVEVVRRTLASEAAVRTDAHLIKYVVSCLDSAAMAPDEAPLFHAAAAYLVALWMREVPEELVLQRIHERG